MAAVCREADERRRKAELRAKRTEEETKRKVRRVCAHRLKRGVMVGVRQGCSAVHLQCMELRPRSELPYQNAAFLFEQDALQAEERERKRKQEAAKSQVCAVQATV